MNFPTKRHEEYIEYIKRVCDQNHFSLILEGSLAHGTAQLFSDIDLILCGNVDADLLDNIISGYDNIVMTNFTENPKGIYILNYKNVISVDLDIRECVLSSEVDNHIILCNYGFMISDNVKRSTIRSNYFPERPQWYKTIRLIHRCSIKSLCGKADVAQGLADEVCKAVYTLTNQTIDQSNSIKQKMIDSLQYIDQSYRDDKSIMDLLEELFRKMKGGIIMKCPICSSEMKLGEINARAGGGLFWLPEGKKANPIVSNNMIEKHNGIVLVDCEETRISREAFVCSECRKIIMNY